MSLSWWWLGAVVVLVATLSGLHWTVLDFLLDRFDRLGAGWLRDGGSEPSDTPAMPQS
jgi:hypothetical protein